MMNRFLLGLTALCSLLVVFAGLLLAADAHSDPGSVLLDEIVLHGTGFEGELAGLVADGRGLSLTDSASMGEFTSAPLRAPIPFNVIVPQWVAAGRDADGVTLFVRSGTDGQTWTPWRAVHHNHDWTLPTDSDEVGDMIIVPEADERHRYVQVRASLSRFAAAAPNLQELTLTVIDSTAGPTTNDLAAQPAPDAASEGYPKPPVIPREGDSGWCKEPECVYTADINYHPVSHLILHHTVTENNLISDYAPIVRAIWAYHTFSRGWGDIGYNFIVDPYGNIFEGHRGGDDVVGTHAAGANSGSMGVAMLGDFRDYDPPQGAVDSVVELFSWKADQREIDVFDASNVLPFIDWGVPNLAGHRDVYGTTECPGDRAHSLLPGIRDRIAANIGLESPHIVVDELSPSFTRSNAYWYDGLYQCGYNTHAWYTWSTTNPDLSANWGTWRPFVPAGGLYEIEVYAPYCNTGRGETTGAIYTINHAGGSTDVVVDQAANIGLWTSLGEFYLPAGDGSTVSLIDLTTTDDDLGMWFDAIRLRPLTLAPTANNLFPSDSVWLSDRTVTFDWEILLPETVTAVTLEVATDDSFATPIHTETFDTPVTSSEVMFDDDYAALYWRIVLDSTVGETGLSQPTHFGIDTTPPTSTITALTVTPQTATYRLEWRGEDALTAVSTYTVETRDLSDETAEWETWLSDTAVVTGLFTAPNPEAAYAFRVQATDLLGNIEPPKDTPDATSEQAVSLSHAIMLPLLD